MTKQDFVLIASVVAASDGTFSAHQKLANQFADRLAATNSRFDRESFIAACMSAFDSCEGLVLADEAEDPDDDGGSPRVRRLIHAQEMAEIAADRVGHGG